MRLALTTLAVAGTALLAACNTQPDESGEEAAIPETATPAPDPEAPVSILRPEIELPEVQPTPIEPLNVTLGFPEGGAELSADVVAALEGVLASEQMALGGPITLRAHSDSDGPDTANEEASEERGLAVARWLIDQGVDSERITVIAFGEQNPIEPNALPDGSPNEEGRALNRRVEVLIVRPRPDAAAADSDGQDPDS